MNNLTDCDKAYMIGMYVAGMKAKEIAIEMNVSLATVYRVTKERFKMDGTTKGRCSKLLAKDKK